MTKKTPEPGHDMLMQEVNDAMRAERMRALWKQFGSKIIYLSLAIVIFTAAFVTWESMGRARSEERSAQLLEGQRHFVAGRFDKAEATFAELSGNSKGGLHQLALIWQAKSLFAQNKQAEGKQLMKQAAQQTGGEKSWQAYSCLTLAWLEDPAANECMNTEKGKPFWASLREWRAAHLMKEDKKTEGAELLAPLRDDLNQPYSLTQRVEDMLAATGVGEKPAEEPAQ